jgi:ribose 5-phosphate isomerase B
VDYPVYGAKCAEAIISGEADRGIVICATGVGISIAANRYKGVRCALCTDKNMAEMTRRHNDANMLALGGRVIGKDTALEITEAWLYTEFEGGERHRRRIGLLG